MENIPAQPKIQGNLDTNFLKLVGAAAMLCDHIGLAFFPQIQILRLIGRIAFPLFAYCLVIGSVYTHDIRRYMIRLGIFALISQPFYALFIHPNPAVFLSNLVDLNIFFTLLTGLATIYALQTQNWLLFLLLMTAACLCPLDYGIYGVGLILLFYLLRSRKSWSALIATLYLAADFFTGGLPLTGTRLGLQGFAVLALPLIYCKTAVHPKIHRYFLYFFYPAHLFLLYLLGLLLHTTG